MIKNKKYYIRARRLKRRWNYKKIYLHQGYISMQANKNVNIDYFTKKQCKW